MAGATTTTTMNDTVYATELEHEIQRELRPHRIFMNLLRHAPDGNSLVFTFTTLDDTGGTVQDITEATTDLISSLQDVNTTGTTATTAQHGLAALVPDLLERVSILDVNPTVQGVLGRQMAEAYDIAAQATIDNYSNATGGATTNSFSRMLTVISALEQRDVGSTGENLVAGLHPKQWGELRSDFATTTAAMAGNDQNTMIGEVLAAKLDGFVGTYFRVPTFQSTSISSASSAYQGWIMAAGQAVGDYNLWLERVEMQRDASKVSWEIIVTSCYGFALIDNNRIQGWRSTV